MKATYIKPEMAVCHLMPDTLLAASGPAGFSATLVDTEVDGADALSASNIIKDVWADDEEE